MSYLLCGFFRFKSNLTAADLEDFAFTVVDKSSANRLSIQLGVCIVQPIVFEIIGDNNLSKDENSMPFLITGSPISDVSDDLIDFDDLGEGTERLERTLKQLQSLLSEIKNEDVVTEANIYFSEGYDNNFKDIISSLESFDTDCLKIFRSAGETISLSVKINLL